MRFIKKIDESSGRGYAFLDLEGAQIPGLTSDPTPLLSFYVDTYSGVKASNKKLEEWNRLYGVLNPFIDTLTDEEQIKYASSLIAMHYRVKKAMSAKEIDGHSLIATEHELGAIMDELVTDIDLPTKLRAYVEKHIPVSVGVRVGERPQDSADKTFYRDEGVELISLAMLLKMMSPILGTFLMECDNDTCGSYKEIHCLTIVKNVLEHHYAKIIEKTSNYVLKAIEPLLKNKMSVTESESSMTQPSEGFTLNVQMQRVFAELIVKRFVTVDLERDGESNFITYMHSAAKHAARSKVNRSRSTVTVLKIKPVTENTTSSDGDGNVSSLENESQITERTVDTIIIIREAVRQTKSKFIADYELNEEVIDAAEAFYMNNPLTLNVINGYILASMFGRYMCGAKSIEMVDSLGLATLTAVAQVYLIGMGYDDIAHLLTANTTGMPKVTKSSNDIMIDTSWNKSSEYHACDMKFSIPIAELRWDTALSKIKTDLTSDVKVYGTAPAIWELLEEESHNGNRYEAPGDIPRRICALLLDLFP